MRLTTAQQAVVHGRLAELQLVDQSLRTILRVVDAGFASILEDDVARLTGAVRDLVAVIGQAENADLI